MKRDDVIRLAMQAWEEAGEGWVVKGWFEDRSNALEAFAKLVAEHEREACAKLVSDIEWKCIMDDVDDTPLKEISKAIRARGQA